METIVEYKIAAERDAPTIVDFVVRLTKEISSKINADPFSSNLADSASYLSAMITDNKYGGIIGWLDDQAIAVSTFTESYALYAGGKIGIIPEFYVAPEFRSKGVGEQLLSHLKKYGREHDWLCIELCTPPLPEFARTLDFYQRSGLAVVGGRKMRQYL